MGAGLTVAPMTFPPGKGITMGTGSFAAVRASAGMARTCSGVSIALSRRSERALSSVRYKRLSVV